MPYVMLIIAMLAGSLSIKAETYQTIINNGSSQNRVDIAILGDGYTTAQLAQYHADVQNFFASVFAQEPYREYQRYYNVHMIDVVSGQSGADHSDRNPPVFVNTGLDAAYNCGNIQRLVCVNTDKVDQVISRTLAAGQFDIVFVLVNDAEYGGSGGSVAVASTNSAAVELILHEVGHSFGLLADEYAGGGPDCNPNIEPGEPNATRATTLSAIKWNYWIDMGTPIPTTSVSPGIAGLFLGAKYCAEGLYRPTYLSKMNVLGYPFEQINTEQHVKRIYNFVSPLDSSFPTGNSLTLRSDRSQTFNVTVPQPFTRNLSVTWQVDGQSVGTGTVFSLSGSSLPFGSHVVRAVVRDLTPLVRNDPQMLLTASRSWNVSQFAASHTPFDYDADGRADLSVRRPSNNIWYILRGSSGYMAMEFGVSGDLMTPADFDGDGKTDVAIFRPSVGTWFIFNSGSQTFTTSRWGQSGDLPVPADFDGDGKADLGEFRGSSGSGSWFIKTSGNTITSTTFGLSGDKPVIGDFDGDGKSDIALFRPSDNNWYILKTGFGFFVQTWGEAGDVPVPADYDGDGKTDVAVFRPSTGQWFRIRSTVGFDVVNWGTNGDKPIPADYDGDGKADVAVFRPSNSNWYIVGSASGQLVQNYGVTGDVPTEASFIY